MLWERKGDMSTMNFKEVVVAVDIVAYEKFDAFLLVSSLLSLTDEF